VTGIAVHVGARVMSLGAANDVLVSGAFHDLLAGSRVHFQFRGNHPLKGLPGVFGIYSLVAA